MGELEGYKLDYLNPLGQGSYGIVFKAQSKQTKHYVAAKRILVTYSPEYDSRIKAVKREIEMVKTLGEQHENIIKLIKTQEIEDGVNRHFWIVTEFCSLHDLEKYAHRYYLSTGNHLDIMVQSARGLAFMHSQHPPIIHRDVKPTNILMTLEQGRHVVKLADFGVARTFESGDRSVETMTAAGTKAYMGPELIDEGDYYPKMCSHHHKTGAQDSWAHGLVSYQLVSSDPSKGIYCPEVTDTTIGKVMLKCKEIEDMIDGQKEKWKEEMKSAISEESTDEGGIDKDTSIQNKIDKREKAMRNRLWKTRSLAKSEPTKDWTPIIIQASNSDVVKSAKQLIQTQVRFDPRERSSMNHVVEQLEGIMKMLPAQPPIPRLTASLSCTTVPKMDKISSHKLGFVASVFIGFNRDGAVVEDIHHGKIVKYTMNRSKALKSLFTSGYTTVWEKPLPTGVRSCSHMCVLSNSNVVFGHDNVTVVCDGDLNPIHTHTGDYGRLCGVVHDKLIYCNRSSNDYVLNVYDGNSHQYVCRLNVSVSSDYISTASHPVSGWFVLTDLWGYTMYLFTSDYQLHTQVKLRFRAWRTNSVCCVGELIAVAGWDEKVIQFYNWAGEGVKQVGLWEMGLEGEIGRVGDGGEGRIQVYTCDNYLHVLKISQAE